MVGQGATLVDVSPVRPGIILGGRYRLVARIGAGGMGEVWRAEHTSLATLAAVKVLDTAVGADADERLKRFHQEARAAAHLKSPHIVQVLDYGVEGRIAFIAMELLEGEGLDHRLSRLGRLPPAETARVIAGMARGLSRAHAAGVLHRDLKPANVFLAKEPNGEVVKLLDFGIAKILGARNDAPVNLSAAGHDGRALPARPQALTLQGNVIGTPSYMSPEQVRGSEMDHRSDLWQMGIIAFECITGHRPFEGPTLSDTFMRICSMPPPMPSSFGPVPSGFDAWIQRSLSRDRENRFSSATEMAAALLLILSPGERDALITGSSAAFTGRHSWSNEIDAQARGSKRWPIAVFAGLTLVLAGAGAFWFLGRTGSDPATAVGATEPSTSSSAEPTNAAPTASAEPEPSTAGPSAPTSSVAVDTPNPTATVSAPTAPVKPIAPKPLPKNDNDRLGI